MDTWLGVCLGDLELSPSLDAASSCLGCRQIVDALNSRTQSLGTEFDDLVLVATTGNVSESTKRKKRGGRRLGQSDRGRPSDDAVRELAHAYLEVQSRYWPDRVRQGELPKSTDAVLDGMVAEFHRRFSAESPFDDLTFDDGIAIACSYSRYSSDNSNPRSLAQQLRLQLDRAATFRHFIPWSLVFADAAITGTTAARRGYEMAKLALASDRLPVTALFIDEIGRASRDQVEALTLGRMIEKLNKRLVGASDGFDSQVVMSKLQLSIFASLQEWFIDQLRAKVIRGQDDAFRRGANTGLPAPGYKLETMRDKNGREMFGADEMPIRKEVIDEEEAKVILQVFIWFAIDLKSPEWISNQLNLIRFRGRVTWDGSRVRQLLRRRTYAGIKCFRMTRQVRDRITGAVTVIKIPKSKWKVKIRRELKIISRALWKKTKARLRFLRDVYEKNLKHPPTRSTAYPKTLVRPVCDICEYEMILGRSGTFASFVCHNGIHGKHGCTARGYKSVKHVEDSVLREVVSRLADSKMADQITEQANRFLIEYADQPRPDLKPLRSEIKSMLHRQRKILALTENGKSKIGVVRKRLKTIEKRLQSLRRQLNAAETASVEPPTPITREAVVGNLGRLRELLDQDVGAAAPILLELTGPVRITQLRETGRRGWRWTAHFTLNLVPVLAKIERQSGLPNTSIWEFLNTRGWTIQQMVVVRVGNPLKADLLAVEVGRLLGSDVGSLPKMSVNAVAVALCVPWEDAKSALRRLESGEPLPTTAAKCCDRPKRIRSKATDVAGTDKLRQVVRLRDQQKRTFPKIAEELGLKEWKVRQLYDLGHPEKVAAAVAARRCPDRGGYSHLGPDKYKEIRELLALGIAPIEVAKRAQVGASTVYRELNRMKSISSA